MFKWKGREGKKARLISGWNQRVKVGVSFSKKRLKFEIEDKSFSKWDRNAGEIDKGKGGLMTEE